MRLEGLLPLVKVGRDKRMEGIIFLSSMASGACLETSELLYANARLRFSESMATWNQRN